MKKRLKRKNFFGSNIRLNVGNCAHACSDKCPPLPTHAIGATQLYARIYAL